MNIILGPPGTGKTQTLLDIVDKAIEDGISPEKIAFLAFTKKAANEAKDRAKVKFNVPETKLIYFRTIHSLAFRQLSLSKTQVMQREHYQELGKVLGINISGYVDMSEGSIIYGMDIGDRLIFLDGLSRTKQIPLRQIWEECGYEDVSWFELEKVAATLVKYKAARGLYDFTDMLEMFCKRGYVPETDLLIIDEAQDLSTLQWTVIERLTARANSIYVAGDDDQCQPGETLIATTSGPIQLKDLNETKHKVLSFRKDTGYVYGRTTNGFTFKKSSRVFKGSMYKVISGQCTSISTPEHRWFVRFKEETITNPPYVVYLMRSNTKYRIGKTLLFRCDRVSALWTRTIAEQADAVWVLGVYYNEIEAMVAEQKFAWKYGIPTLCFMQTYYDIDKVYDGFNSLERAKELLGDLQLLIDKPFFDKERMKNKRRGSQIFLLETCNILSDLMEIGNSVPEVDKYVQWKTVKVERLPYTETTVYSLNVKPYHSYVADGLISSNSIFSWSGANTQHFINLSGKVRSLSTSWRVPETIHGLALSIVKAISNRRDKTWKSYNNGGEVQWHDNIETVPLDKGQWLILTRNGYMLKPVEDHCIVNGFSFDGRFSPLKSPTLTAIRLWERLRQGEDITFDQARKVVSYISQKINMQTLSGFDRIDMKTLELIANVKNTRKIWHEALDRISPYEREYFIAARRAGETLVKTPRLKLSTIHGAKGGEADNVLLFTDLAPKTYDEFLLRPDDEHRVFYVGVTRAKQTLHLMQPRTNKAFLI